MLKIYLWRHTKVPHPLGHSIRTNENRAKKNGELLATAVLEAKSKARRSNIATFLSENWRVYDEVEGVDAPILTMKSGEQIVLGYEWQFLEDSETEEVVQDILDSIDEALSASIYHARQMTTHYNHHGSKQDRLVSGDRGATTPTRGCGVRDYSYAATPAAQLTPAWSTHAHFHYDHNNPAG